MTRPTITVLVAISVVGCAGRGTGAPGACRDDRRRRDDPGRHDSPGWGPGRGAGWRRTSGHDGIERRRRSLQRRRAARGPLSRDGVARRIRDGDGCRCHRRRHHHGGRDRSRDCDDFADRRRRRIGGHRVAGRHADAGRRDWRPRTRTVRAGRRLSGGASAAGQHHRSAGRRQHQRRPSQPGGCAARRRHAGRPVHRPHAGLAARRCHRFGGGAAESVRRGVRALLVRTRRHPDPPRRRRLEDAAQQPRSRRSGSAAAAQPFDIKGIGSFGAAAGDGRPDPEGSAVSRADRAVPLLRVRCPEPARGRVAPDEVVQLVHASRRHARAAPFGCRRPVDSSRA